MWLSREVISGLAEHLGRRGSVRRVYVGACRVLRGMIREV